MSKEMIDKIMEILEPVKDENAKTIKIWIEADADLQAKLQMVKDSIKGHEDKDWTFDMILIDAFESKFARVMEKAAYATVLQVIQELADRMGIEMKPVTREEYEAYQEVDDEE